MSREEKRQFYQNRARENRKLEKTRDLNVILKDVAAEQPGYLEKDNDDEVITQYEIMQNVDMFSAQKYFDLDLDNFGPYRLNYTKKRKAPIDWGSTRPCCGL